MMVSWMFLLAFHRKISFIARTGNIGDVSIFVLILDQKADHTLGMQTEASTDQDANKELVAVWQGHERLNLVIEIDQIGEERVVRREKHDENITETSWEVEQCMYDAHDRCNVMKWMAVLVRILMILTGPKDDDDGDNQDQDAWNSHSDQIVSVVRCIQQPSTFAFEHGVANARDTFYSIQTRKVQAVFVNRALTFWIVKHFVFLLILQHFDGIDIENTEDKYQEHGRILRVDIV